MNARQLVERLPPRVGLTLRAEKNRWNLHGLHAPASVLSDLVPPGRAAVEVGANRGVYSYWIAKRAHTVWAFEPNPGVFAVLARGAPSQVRAENVALSDHDGPAFLTIPGSCDGEATLERNTGALTDQDTRLTVQCRTLDSYAIPDVGFLKIDVEGHEIAVLSGAISTLWRSRPTVLIELEERHRIEAVNTAARFLLGELGYRRAFFMRRGNFEKLADFDTERDQLCHAARPSSPDYVSNFLFLP